MHFIQLLEMIIMRKQQGNESNNMILEAYYAGIGKAHVDNIIDDLRKNKDEIEAIEVPESLDRWVHEYDEKEKLAEKHKKMLSSMKQFSKRAVIIILVLISAMSVLMFSVEAVRVRVLNFFIERNEKYTEVRIEEENQNLTPAQDWASYYIPEYLPEGYFFSNSSGLGLLKVLEYTDEVNQIVITQGSSTTGIQLDTEDAEVRELTIDGKEGLLILKGDRTMMFWYNDDASFTINGHISEEEIIKIFRSMEKVAE